MKRAGAALIVALVVSAGCGSAHSDRELAAAATRAAGATNGPSPGAAPAPVAATDPSASAATSAPQAAEAGPGATTVAAAGAQTTAAAGAANTPAAAGTAGPRSAAGSGSASGAGPGPGASPGSGGTTKSGGATSATTPGTPAVPAAPGTGARPDIVLGEIGTLSGVAGQGLAPTADAARAWTADVNARGGLNGHKVRLVTGDDGGDPARALALARRMVDQDKISAFYAQSMVLTLQAVVPFAEEKKIPIIGGCNCATIEAHSPMVFDVGAGAEVGVAYAFVLPLIAYSTERKVSVIYCREIAACAQGADNVRKKIAPVVGLQIVHEAQASLAQPDFTAEVLAARNAGAAAIVVYMDNPSLIRIKRSAQRQGWTPLISTAWASLDDRFLKDGGADAEGVLIGAPLATWLSPKMADYVAAMSRYVPGGIKAGVGITAWAAGKLIERVAPAFPAGDVSSADILRALYSVNGETLGGIVAPVTFREGQVTPETTCSVLVKVEKGRYVARDGDNYFCPPTKN